MDGFKKPPRARGAPSLSHMQAWRGKLARRLYLFMIDTKRHYMQRCNWAAGLLQSRWRGRQGRRRFCMLRAAEAKQVRD